MTDRDSQVRGSLARRMNGTIRAVATASDLNPRDAVASLALDGCLLGTFAHAYPGTTAWWEDALTAVSSYAGLRLPPLRIGSIEARWDEFPMRDDRPLLDAVLTLISAGGVDALSMERIALIAERDVRWLTSSFGSVEELLDELFEVVLSDGFDDLAPLRLERSRAAVQSMLEVLTNSRRTASLLRMLALSGIEVSAGAALATRGLSPVAQPGHARLSGGEWVAALAIDAWALGSTARRAEWPHAMDDAVVVELHRLIRT